MDGQRVFFKGLFPDSCSALVPSRQPSFPARLPPFRYQDEDGDVGGAFTRAGQKVRSLLSD